MAAEKSPVRHVMEEEESHPVQIVAALDIEEMAKAAPKTVIVVMEKERLPPKTARNAGVAVRRSVLFAMGRATCQVKPAQFVAGKVKSRVLNVRGKGRTKGGILVLNVMAVG